MPRTPLAAVSVCRGASFLALVMVAWWMTLLLTPGPAMARPPGEQVANIIVYTSATLDYVDLTTGETLAMRGLMNPQIAYGEDVISRIAYTMDHAEEGNILQKRPLHLFKTGAAGVTSRGGGEKQGVAIVRALYFDAEIIILDEPTAGMTREDTIAFIDMIDRITSNLTSIVIEHDMDVVFSLASTVSVLHYGSILVSGTPDEIRNDPRVKDAYLGEEE